MAAPGPASPRPATAALSRPANVVPGSPGEVRAAGTGLGWVGAAVPNRAVSGPAGPGELPGGAPRLSSAQLCFFCQTLSPSPF